MEKITHSGYFLPANLPYYIWKVANTLYKYHIPLVPFVLQQVLRFVFCCCLSYKTKMGTNVHLAHNGLGIVINPNCEIGDNVMIHHNVTLAGSKIGNWVQIFPGARVVNMVRIGNNVKIAPNSLVARDVPDASLAIGVPARIVPRKSRASRREKSLTSQS